MLCDDIVVQSSQRARWRLVTTWCATCQKLRQMDGSAVLLKNFALMLQQCRVRYYSSWLDAGVPLNTFHTSTSRLEVDYAVVVLIRWLRRVSSFWIAAPSSKNGIALLLNFAREEHRRAKERRRTTLFLSFSFFFLCWWWCRPLYPPWRRDVVQGSSWRLFVIQQLIVYCVFWLGFSCMSRCQTMMMMMRAVNNISIDDSSSGSSISELGIYPHRC